MDQSGSLKVLIAERHRTVAQSLGRVVAELGRAEVAATVVDAAGAIEAGTKIAPDVAIVDLDLSPNCNLVRGLHSLLPDTRIIVLAEKGAEATPLVNALAAGAVGAIYKESSVEELARALSRSSTATPVVAEEATGVLLNSYVVALQDKRRRDLATIEALAAAVEARDATTGHHLARVRDLARHCMEAVDTDLAQNEEMSYGFTLHDIGKIGVPDAILNKPGPLGAEEWSIMQRHPEMGVKIVEPLGFSSNATDVILCHHERWDGTGYPNGLMRNEIPLAARVFAVADAYDAMTSDRPYRAAMGATAVKERLREESGAAYDPDVVQVFLDLTE